jgi:hypothetical protein
VEGGGLEPSVARSRERISGAKSDLQEDNRAGDALRLPCRWYFRRLARALGAPRDGNGRFQLDEPLGDELRPIIRAFLSPLRT